MGTGELDRYRKSCGTCSPSMEYLINKESVRKELTFLRLQEYSSRISLLRNKNILRSIYVPTQAYRTILSPGARSLQASYTVYLCCYLFLFTAFHIH
jgi:hypothetical protein